MSATHKKFSVLIIFGHNNTFCTDAERNINTVIN